MKAKGMQGAVLENVAMTLEVAEGSNIKQVMDVSLKDLPKEVRSRMGLLEEDKVSALASQLGDLLLSVRASSAATNPMTPDQEDKLRSLLTSLMPYVTSRFRASYAS